MGLGPFRVRVVPVTKENLSSVKPVPWLIRPNLLEQPVMLILTPQPWSSCLAAVSPLPFLLVFTFGAGSALSKATGILPLSHRFCR